MNKNHALKNIAPIITITLGLFSFAIFLLYHNIADGDLWARLVQGASILNTGHMIHKDIFAFTPVLSEYIDHEWGAGLIFFWLLKFLGPDSLLWLKVLSATGTLFFAAYVARLNGAGWKGILLIAIPCAFCIFPAYIPVVRSHVFTFLFFAVTVFCLEKIKRGCRWPVFLIGVIMIMWVNVHGGFASGLGVILIYAAFSISQHRIFKTMILALIFSAAATFFNPYGLKLWNYLLTALTMNRTNIGEWGFMPALGMDPYVGFRVLLIIVGASIIVGWSRTRGKISLYKIILVAITVFIAIRHRRHAPFFGLAVLMFLVPIFEAALYRINYRPKSFTIVMIYGAIALTAALFIMPEASFHVLAPAGFYPVREADILMYAKAEGNAAVPLRWGNYVMWRLYPRIKISMCGRYEAMYPQSTYEMNYDFFYKRGKDWERLVRDYKVDYVLLEPNNTALGPEDLKKLGFDAVWQSKYSCLYARPEYSSALKDTVKFAPPLTIEPLDARIPEEWTK